MLAFIIKLSCLNLLKVIKTHLSVGNISIKGKYVQYQAVKFQELWHVIIPHFIDNPLFKANDLVFVKFVTILVVLYPHQNKVKPHKILRKILVLTKDINAGSSNKEKINWSKLLSVTSNFNSILLINDSL